MRRSKSRLSEIGFTSCCQEGILPTKSQRTARQFLSTEHDYSSGVAVPCFSCRSMRVSQLPSPPTYMPKFPDPGNEATFGSLFALSSKRTFQKEEK
jgi:hypothetical protein